MTLPDGFVFNGNVFREFTRNELYSDRWLPELAEGWQYLASQAGTPPAALSQTGPALPSGVPSDNGTAALYSVLCDNAAWPRSVDTYQRNVAIGRRVFPATAGMPDNAWPCAFWATRPVEPPVKVTDRGPRNVLILQNLRDPATPWISGHGLREALGKRAAFVSVDQGGHGVYLLTNAPCAGDIATAFLTGGTLPARDKLCPGQTPPGISAQATVPRVRLPGPLG